MSTITEFFRAGVAFFSLVFGLFVGPSNLLLILAWRAGNRSHCNKYRIY